MELLKKKKNCAFLLILNWEYRLSCKIISLSPAAKLHLEIVAVAAERLSSATAALFAVQKFPLDKPKLLACSN